MSKKTPEPTDKHVGARVRMRRMMKGVSQTTLGEQLGITFQQVQKYEKGANRIGASRLQQIAAILGVSVGFFFEGAPNARQQQAGIFNNNVPQDEYVSQFLATREGLDLAKGFMALKSDKQRRSVVALVDAMAA